MKFLIVLLVIGFGFIGNAQEVVTGGVAYEVKGKAVFKDGVNVTETLSDEKKAEILKVIDKKKLRKPLRILKKN